MVSFKVNESKKLLLIFILIIDVSLGKYLIQTAVRNINTLSGINQINSATNAIQFQPGGLCSSSSLGIVLLFRLPP